MKKRRHRKDEPFGKPSQTPLAARNAKLNAQRRKVLATHYAARYRVR
jgi:hypothetical protein